MFYAYILIVCIVGGCIISFFIIIRIVEFLFVVVELLILEVVSFIVIKVFWVLIS